MDNLTKVLVVSTNTMTKSAKVSLNYNTVGEIIEFYKTNRLSDLERIHKEWNELSVDRLFGTCLDVHRADGFGVHLFYENKYEQVPFANEEEIKDALNKVFS